MRCDFWNHYYETLPREELDRLHLHRGKAVLAHAYANSPFYRRKLDQAGIHPSAIRTLEEFNRMSIPTGVSVFGNWAGTMCSTRSTVL